MAVANISVKTRQETGKGPARRLRSSGLIPGVVYSYDTKPVSVAVPQKELQTIITGAKGNIIFSLKAEGIKQVEGRTAIIKEIQRDPLTSNILHVDFYALTEGHKIEINVPIKVVGKPIGLAQGGMIEIVRREISIRCMPKDILSEIEVDISHLDLHQGIHLSEVKLPESAESLAESDILLVHIITPRALASVETAAAAAAEGAEGAAAAEGAEGAAPADGKAPEGAAAKGGAKGKGEEKKEKESKK